MGAPSVGRTSLAYFCHFLVSGLMGPFISTILVGLGYTHAQVGFTMAVSAVWTIIMPFFVGRLIDDRVPMELIIRTSAAASCFLALLLWTQHNEALAFVVVLFVFYGTRAPLGSLLDTLAMRAANRQGGVYGRIRLLGSVGFMVAATASGWWLADHGKHASFPPLWCWWASQPSRARRCP